MSILSTVAAVIRNFFFFLVLTCRKFLCQEKCALVGYVFPKRRYSVCVCCSAVHDGFPAASVGQVTACIFGLILKGRVYAVCRTSSTCRV